MVFLDFQFLSSGDPMWDLGSTILLNTNLSLDKLLLTSSLQCYYQTFYTKLDQLEATYPKESFETFIQRWVTLHFWRENKKSLFRFYTVGLKSAILFGMMNYDIMVVYDKFVDRFWNVVKMLDLWLDNRCL